MEECRFSVGAYTVLANAIANCKVGYKVYDWNGKAVYENKMNELVKIAKSINKSVKADIINGIEWLYSNSGCKPSYASAVKNKVYRCNCALYICWTLIEAGILKSGQSFYGNYGKIIWRNEETKKAIEKYFDIIEIKGKYTLQQLIDKKMIQAGDILCYQNIQHTNMVGYDGYFYDAGHAYCKEQGELAHYITFKGKAVHAGQAVSHIIRKK